jgi:hypothetical protein
LVTFLVAGFSDDSNGLTGAPANTGPEPKAVRLGAKTAVFSHKSAYLGFSGRWAGFEVSDGVE